jgi:hypothetical protein
MDRKQICRIVFLLAICSMLIDGMVAQDLGEIGRQEREKRRDREKKQQEQQKEQPVKTNSTPKVHRNENVPHGGGLSVPMPSPSPSPRVQPGELPDALPDASPNPSPTKSRVSSAVYLPLLILGLGLSVVGGVWLLVEAFKTSIWWGLGCFFIPFVTLFYLFSYWKEARRPFGLYLLGIVILITSQIAFS